MNRVVLFLAALITGAIIIPHFAAAYTAPNPTKTFYADANGDQQLQLDDLPMHKSQVYLGTPAYNTPQLNNVDDRWNTCDVTGDFRCQLDDMTPLKAAVYLTPLAKGWTSWGIVDVSFPVGPLLITDPATPFQIAPRAVSATIPNARPGVNVMLTVAPDSPVQDVTLGGRACPTPNPKCSVSVGLTAWQTSTAVAPTETAAFGFSVKANSGSGALILVAEYAAQPVMKIAATSVRFTTTVGGTCAIDLTCPANVSETAALNCTFTYSNCAAGSAVTGAANTCTGVTVVDGGAGSGTYTATAQGEAAGPGSCLAAVSISGAPGDSDSASVTIDEANQNPYFTSTAPTSATENVLFSYSPTYADADLPAALPVDPGTVGCQGISGNTCGAWLSFTGCNGSGTPSETDGGIICSYTINVIDGYAATGSQLVSLTIADTNVAPVISNLPSSTSAHWRSGVVSYDADATDADLPAQTLTWSIASEDCSGTPTINSSSGIVSYTCTLVESCLLQVRVMDNGSNPSNLTDIEQLTINCDNTAPNFTSTAPTSVDETVQYSYTPTCNDPDSDPLTITVNGSPDTCNGTISAGIYTFTPTETQGGSTCVVALNCSDTKDTVPQNTTVTIVDTNVAPVITNLPSTTSAHWRSGVVSYDADATDADLPAQTLTWSMPLEFCQGMVNINSTSGLVEYTCPLKESCDVYVIARDNGTNPANLSDQEILTITCTNTGIPSITSTPNTTAMEGAIYSYPITCADSNSDPTTITKNGSDTCNGAITAGTYSFTPGENQGGGTCVVGINCSDTQDSSNQDTTINISEDNKTPALSNLPATDSGPITKNNSFDADATDPDIPADVLNYSLGTDTCSFTPSIIGSTGVVSWTCGEAVENCTVQVTVTDDGTPPPQKSDTQTLTIYCNTSPSLAGTYNTTGNAWGVYTEGGYAYVGDYLAGLRIINISNPASPSLTGTYNTSGYALGVHVAGGYAYVADYAAGLRIINVSNPASPSLTGTYNTSGLAWAVYTAGGYAYVADDGSGLQIINVTNPASPTLAGTYDTTGTAYDVYVAGGYAYVADFGSGLQIINVSNPASPTLAGTYNTLGNSQGVYVTGGYAYVADGLFGLQIIDVSNPASPTLTATYNTPGAANDVYVAGGYAYVADNDYGLQIIDVSNPAAPSLVDFYNTPGTAYGIYVTGGYAYIGDYDYGLQIIQVGYPVTPTILGSYHPGGDNKDVYVSGGYAYLASYAAGIKIINISNPASPTQVGVYNTAGSAYDVFVSGQYAYVADNTTGLQIVNISIPATPTLTGSYDTSGFSLGVSVSGGYAYVADSGSGLQIINVSTPASPTLEGTYNTVGTAMDVFVSGAYAYVADLSGLAIIDISAPASPSLLGSYVTAGSTTGVYVSENYAYLADGDALRIIDVVNPVLPSLVGTFTTYGGAEDVYVSGGYAYVTGGSGELLEVIDVSNPASPTLVDYNYNFAYTARGNFVSGGYAYITDSSGMQVIQISLP